MNDKKTGDVLTAISGGAFNVKNDKVEIEGFKIEVEPGDEFKNNK